MIKVILLHRILEKKMKLKNVIFNKDSEYGITGLNINSILSDEKLLKIENVKEQNKFSLEIQELIKTYNIFIT